MLNVKNLLWGLTTTTALFILNGCGNVTSIKRAPIVPKLNEFLINNNAVSTQSRNVSLSYSVSKAELICFSHLNSVDSCNWLPVAINPSPVSWQLTEGSGKKTVYAWAKSAVNGQITAMLQDDIYFVNATRLRFVVQPWAGSPKHIAGNILSQSPVVEVQDPDGIRVSDATNEITVSAYSDDQCSNAIVNTLNASWKTLGQNPTLTRSALAGQATFNDLESNRAGNVYLKAVSGILESHCSSVIEVTGGTPTQLVVNSQPASATSKSETAGIALNAQPTFLGKDKYDNFTSLASSYSPTLNLYEGNANCQASDEVASGINFIKRAAPNTGSSVVATYTPDTSKAGSPSQLTYSDLSVLRATTASKKYYLGLSASVGGSTLTTCTDDFVIVASAPFQLAHGDASGANLYSTTATAGTNVASFSGKILDAYGNFVATNGINGAIRIRTGSCSGSIVSVTPKGDTNAVINGSATSSSGIFTFGSVQFNNAESDPYYVELYDTAGSSPLQSACLPGRTLAVDAGPVSASESLLAIDGQSSAPYFVDVTQTITLRMTARDQFQNTKASGATPGLTVNEDFNATTGKAGNSAFTLQGAGSGVWTSTLTGNTTGQVQLKGTFNTVALPLAQDKVVTIRAGQPTKLAFVETTKAGESGSHLTAGSWTSNKPKVQVQDAAGNHVNSGYDYSSPKNVYDNSSVINLGLFTANDCSSASIVSVTQPRVDTTTDSAISGNTKVLSNGEADFSAEDLIAKVADSEYSGTLYLGAWITNSGSDNSNLTRACRRIYIDPAAPSFLKFTQAPYHTNATTPPQAIANTVMNTQPVVRMYDAYGNLNALTSSGTISLSVFDNRCSTGSEITAGTPVAGNSSSVASGVASSFTSFKVNVTTAKSVRAVWSGASLTFACADLDVTTTANKLVFSGFDSVTEFAADAAITGNTFKVKQSDGNSPENFVDFPAGSQILYEFYSGASADSGLTCSGTKLSGADIENATTTATGSVQSEISTHASLAVRKKGSYYVQATLVGSSPPKTGCSSSTIKIKAGTLNSIRFVGSPANADIINAGGTLAVSASAPQIERLDAYLNRITSESAQIDIILDALSTRTSCAGNTDTVAGGLSGTLTRTTVSGVSTFSTVTVPLISVKRIRAVVSGDTAKAACIDIDVTTTASSLRFTSTVNLTKTADELIPSAFGVEQRDASGNNVVDFTTGQTVTYSLFTNAACTTSATANDVNATASATSYPASSITSDSNYQVRKAGTYYVKACRTSSAICACSGVNADTNNQPFTLTIDAGAANKLAFSSAPSNPETGTINTPKTSPTIQVEDAFGNIVSGTFNFQIKTLDNQTCSNNDSPSGSVSGGVTISGSNSPVSTTGSGSGFNFAYTPKKTSVQSVHIYSSDIPTGSVARAVCFNTSFTTTPTKLVFVTNPFSSGNPTAITAGGSFPTTSVRMEDNDGNIVNFQSGQTVTFELYQGANCSTAQGSTFTSRSSSSKTAFSGNTVTGQTTASISSSGSFNVNRAGTYSLKASVTNYSGNSITATSCAHATNTLTVNAAAAFALIRPSTQTSTTLISAVTSGTASPSVLAYLEDQHGNPATGDVTWTTGSGSFANANPVAASAGVSNPGTLTAGTVANTYSISASATCSGCSLSWSNFVVSNPDPVITSLTVNGNSNLGDQAPSLNIPQPGTNSTFNLGISHTGGANEYCVDVIQNAKPSDYSSPRASSNCTTWTSLASSGSNNSYSLTNTLRGMIQLNIWIRISSGGNNYVSTSPAITRVNMGCLNNYVYIGGASPFCVSKFHMRSVITNGSIATDCALGNSTLTTNYGVNGALVVGGGSEIHNASPGCMGQWDGGNGGPKFRLDVRPDGYPFTTSKINYLLPTGSPNDWMCKSPAVGTALTRTLTTPSISTGSVITTSQASQIKSEIDDAALSTINYSGGNVYRGINGGYSSRYGSTALNTLQQNDASGYTAYTYPNLTSASTASITSTLTTLTGIERRTLYIASGDVIWDFYGNVRTIVYNSSDSSYMNHFGGRFDSFSTSVTAVRTLHESNSSAVLNYNDSYSATGNNQGYGIRCTYAAP